jgi:hypothetical protein
MNQQVISGTLVLVAAQSASPREMHEAADQACAVHNGPVIVLPHNWTAMPVELVRAQLDAVEREQRKNIGPSKPPPPPPPPAAHVENVLSCPVCHGPPTSAGKHKLLESMPPIIVWCDDSRSLWDNYPSVL